MTAVVGTVAAGLVVAVAVGQGASWRRTNGPTGHVMRVPGGGARAQSMVVTALGAVLHPPDPTRPVVDMVAFLDAVARGLRGGIGLHASVRGAVSASGVHADTLRGLVGSLDTGVPLSVALARWRGSTPSREVSLAAAVLGFGVATGGSVARAVDGAAATLREHLAIAGESRVLATQARASALVVGGAPVAFTIVVVLADPRVGGVLFGSPVGWCCLVVGGALEVACVVWMRRLVAQAAGR